MIHLSTACAFITANVVVDDLPIHVIESEKSRDNIEVTEQNIMQT